MFRVCLHSGKLIFTFYNCEITVLVKYVLKVEKSNRFAQFKIFLAEYCVTLDRPVTCFLSNMHCI